MYTYMHTYVYMCSHTPVVHVKHLSPAPLCLLAGLSGTAWDNAETQLVDIMTVSPPGASSEPAIPAQKKPVIPTEKKPVIPTEKEPVIPTEKEPVIPSEKEPVIPTCTEKEPVITTEKEPVIPVEKEPVIPTKKPVIPDQGG